MGGLGGFGQTGPMTGQPMRRWLVITEVLETLNGIVLFPVSTWLLGPQFPALTGQFAWLGVGTLGIVLVEGGAYWLLKRGGWFERTPAATRQRLLRGVSIANVALLCVFPALLVAAPPTGNAPLSVGDLALGAFWYLCGVGEFVHYFVVKINMRGRELRRVLRTGKPVPARIRRELRRAAAQAGAHLRGVP